MYAMHAVTFDTLNYAKKLEARGVPQEQAEAHAEALAVVLEERVTSKQETNDSIGKVSNEIALLRQDLSNVETSLRKDINTLETSLRQEIKSSASDVKSEIIKWVFGISFAGCVNKFV